MNKFYAKAVMALLLSAVYLNGHGQATLPYTLTFTANDPTAWSDGIAQDGDGGTQTISTLHIQIYAATAAFTLLPGSTIVWYNNGYLSSGEADYTAITPGPDVQVSNDGVPAMVMKSTSQANNFSLESIRLYDWGGNPTTTIATYNDGVLVGSINVTFVNLTTKTITQADALTPSLFNNIDEVRFYPNGAPAFWLSFNNIRLNNPPAVTPVQLVYFKGAARNDHSVQLQWETAQEENAAHFEVEQSEEGTKFTEIGKVSAKGNSSLPTDYTFIDQHPQPGTGFYRLKEVDKDGKSMYSNVLSVATSGDPQQLYIYPNPSTGLVHIDGPGGTIRAIKVYSASGVLVQSISDAGATATVDLTGQPRGVYYCILTLESGTVRKMILRQ